MSLGKQPNKMLDSDLCFQIVPNSFFFTNVEAIVKVVVINHMVLHLATEWLLEVLMSVS